MAKDFFQYDDEGGILNDGIGECEQLIIAAGGTVNRGMITLPKDWQNIPAETKDAVNFLCNEWDYAVL